MGFSTQAPSPAFRNALNKHSLAVWYSVAPCLVSWYRLGLRIFERKLEESCVDWRWEERQETIKPNSLRATELLKQLLLKQGHEPQAKADEYTVLLLPAITALYPASPHPTATSASCKASPPAASRRGRGTLGTSLTPASLPFAFPGLSASFGGRNLDTEKPLTGTSL